MHPRACAGTVERRRPKWHPSNVYVTQERKMKVDRRGLMSATAALATAAAFGMAKEARAAECVPILVRGADGHLYHIAPGKFEAKRLPPKLEGQGQNELNFSKAVSPLKGRIVVKLGLAASDTTTVSVIDAKLLGQ
jgi:hypothetical protein